MKSRPRSLRPPAWPGGRGRDFEISRRRARVAQPTGGGTTSAVRHDRGAGIPVSERRGSTATEAREYGVSCRAEGFPRTTQLASSIEPARPCSTGTCVLRHIPGSGCLLTGSSGAETAIFAFAVRISKPPREALYGPSGIPGVRALRSYEIGCENRRNRSDRKIGRYPPTVACKRGEVWP